MSSARWLVTSPNEGVAFELDNTEPEGVSGLTYRVLHKGHEAVAASRLGIAHARSDFIRVTVAAASGVATLDYAYDLAHGKRREVRSQAHAQMFTLRNRVGEEAWLVVRVSDDGVAFRYVLEDHGGAPTPLTAESTEFRLAEGRAWIQPHDAAGEFTPAYEALYSDGTPIGTTSPGPSWNMPALFHTNRRWVLLAEADLVPPAFGAHLRCTGTTYRIVPPEPDEGLGIGEVWPSIDGEWQSPWRVIVVGDDLGTIAETTLITDLASPSCLDDVSWIRPGRASWSWWSDHDSPKSLEALRRYVDFAADMGWEHTLVDANWTVHDEPDLRQLIDDARQREVGVWLWYNSGGPHNTVTEQPRDRMYERERRRDEMAKLTEWGVAGVKVDFFQSDKPEILRLMWDLLADAADHRLMVNLHGCTVPRGWQRTWPHLMTMEGVRGAEQYAFAREYPETAVWHNTILPYTRNVVGPMDYTPVTIGDQLYPHVTTAAHEIALAVLYESGVQHYADSIESYEALPPEVRGLLERVPAAWDDTRHVAGYPGSHSVIARRSDGAWYVAGIAGREAVTIDVHTPWLASSRPALLVADGAEAELTVTEVTLDPAWPFAIDIPTRGGFVLATE